MVVACGGSAPFVVAVVVGNVVQEKVLGDTFGHNGVVGRILDGDTPPE